MSRRIYLRMLHPDEAARDFLQRFPLGGWRDADEVPTVEACGRVTAEPIFARLSSPAYHAAAMDGLAVQAEITYRAHVDRPLQVALGSDAFPVNTGNPLPPGTNAVIMIENVVEIDEHTVQIEAPAYPWQHVRKVGEDIVATEQLLPQSHRLTPFDLGALLGAGLLKVRLKPKPRVAVVPTGSELITPEQLQQDDVPKPGKIIEYNSIVLAEMIREWGGEPVRLPVCPDEPADLRRVLEEALEEGADVLIVNAGSSAGSEDHTASVIEELGEVIAHGVTMMPGKPTILGTIRDRPVLGNPGYPVSAVVSCEQFVKPLIGRLLGVEMSSRPRMTAHVSRKVPSRIGMEELLRVKLGQVNEKVVATPLSRAAGAITTLTQADGILRISSDVEGLQEGAEVEVELLRTPEEIKRTLVAIGSHDLTLDLLADRMSASGKGYLLASSNVGSLGGLIALRKGHAHLAGSHLLDPASGEYNIPYIKRFLSGLPVRLVHLVYREQGFILPAGNPLGIHGLEDLRRPDVMFINRQAGSGTRILLDYHLDRLKMDPKGIRGYEREAFTHMDVAVAVKSGAADTGMGILAAAQALALDFIPVTKERYDLVIPAAFCESEAMELLMLMIGSTEFRKSVERMGGYDPAESGKILI